MVRELRRYVSLTVPIHEGCLIQRFSTTDSQRRINVG